jgi:pimeloyl-ACP methyl ester carboxylesterase
MTMKHLLAGIALSTSLVTAATSADQQPFIVVFGAAAVDTLAGAYGGSLVPDLRQAGYDVRSLDLPCHGPGETGLACWSEKVAANAGESMLGEFCGRVGDLMSELGVDHAQFVGILRGAFVAAYCGGRDSRVTDIGMIAPRWRTWSVERAFMSA